MKMKDTERALKACKTIIDERHPVDEFGPICMTAEHAVATLFLALFNKDARRAAVFFNEAFVPGVEQRMAFYAKHKGTQS